MALICYNGSKECDGCMWCYDNDPYEIEDDNIDELYDSYRDKKLLDKKDVDL